MAGLWALLQFVISRAIASLLPCCLAFAPVSVLLGYLILGYVIIDTNYQLEILAINYLSVVKR
jgi:Kef-type K+ transport system membrane component KefB